jgi:hypothetical protein
VTRSVRATTTARESSHPKMKAAPFRTLPFEERTKTNAVSGMGSRVMANPMSKRSRTTEVRLPSWTSDRYGKSALPCAAYPGGIAATAVSSIESTTGASGLSPAAFSACHRIKEKMVTNANPTMT